MQGLFKQVRQKVSADKNRYQRGSYDLDLTYITDRIIAMAFPADGMEAYYRNKIDDVARLLKENHGRNFLLYNLSNRPYDPSKFDNQVIEWCGFPDHHPAPVWLLFKIIHSIHDFLLEDPQNVVCIHCLAGKGRTGSIIASYMMLCGLFDSGQEALNFFAYKRSLTNWGVTGASQLRYITYVEDILVRSIQLKLDPLKLTCIILDPVPRFQLGSEKGCTPIFEIYTLSREKELKFSSFNLSTEIKSFTLNKKMICLNLNCEVRGDILIHFRHVYNARIPSFGGEEMFHFVFNTGMVQGCLLELGKDGLDVAAQDSRFPHDFKVTLCFEPVEQVSEVIQQQSEEEQLWPMRRARGALDGSIVFTCDADTKIAQARDIGNPLRGNIAVKGGWLMKRGHKIKNWKWRWFVLRNSVLSYHKSPREAKFIKMIPLTLVREVHDCSNVLDEEKIHCFEIETDSLNYLICASSAHEKQHWMDAIHHAMAIRLTMQSNQIGTLHLRIVEAIDVEFSGLLYVSAVLEQQKLTAVMSERSESNRLLFNADFDLIVTDNPNELYLMMSFQEPDKDKAVYVGEWSMSTNAIRASSSRLEDWYAFTDEDGKSMGKVHLVIDFEKGANDFRLNDETHSPSSSSSVVGGLPSSPPPCDSSFIGQSWKRSLDDISPTIPQRRGTQRQQQQQRTEARTFDRSGFYSRSELNLRKFSRQVLEQAAALGEAPQPPTSSPTQTIISASPTQLSPDSPSPPMDDLPTESLTVRRKFLQCAPIASQQYGAEINPRLGQTVLLGNRPAKIIETSPIVRQPASNWRNVDLPVKRPRRASQLLSKSLDDSPPTPPQQQEEEPPSSSSSSSSSQQQQEQPSSSSQQQQQPHRQQQEQPFSSSQQQQQKPQQQEQVDPFVRKTSAGFVSLRSVLVVGDRLLTGDIAGNITVWDCSTLAKVQFLRGHNGAVNSMIAVNGTLWSASEEEVFVWNLSRLELTERLKNSGSVKTLLLVDMVDPGGSVVWAGSLVKGSRGTISVWETTSRECKRIFNLENAPVCVMCRHGDLVWVGTIDFVVAFDVHTFANTCQIKVEIGPIDSIIAIDKTLWFSSFKNATILVYDEETHQQLTTLTSHADCVRQLMRVDKQIWSCSNDNRVLIWNVDSRKCWMDLKTPISNPVIRLCTDGRFVFGIGSDKTIYQWKA